MITVCALLASLVSLVGASEVARVPHRASPLPEGWRVLGRAVLDDHPVTLRLALKQQNLDQVYRIARMVSDPSHPQYGKYIGKAELQKLTAPLAAHVVAVEEWLTQIGAPFVRTGAAGETIEASFTAAVATTAFGCRFHFTANGKTGQEILQAGDYWLPKAVDDAIAAVYGMHGLPAPTSWVRTSSVESESYVVPSVITKAYNVSGIEASGSKKNRQAVVAFIQNKINTSDLSLFFKKFLPSLPASDATLFEFVGKTNGTGIATTEASADIQYIMGVAPNVLTEFWNFGDGPMGLLCENLKNWTDTILASDDPPKVHSASYGMKEFGQLELVCRKSAQIQDIDANFAKLAARGITMIFSSGDDGLIQDREKSATTWPASSPWVTAVGSTRFIKGNQGPEMASSTFGSGGGFSKLFGAFQDQQAAVEGYLSTAPNLPPRSLFNESGRATPDVAVLGENFIMYKNGHPLFVSGTSFSAPAFASMVSLLNEARIQSGKPPMGYLNPWLYQHPEMFTDVVVGNNAISRHGEKLKYGFECTKGWDPVTGLGTPIFSEMLKIAMEKAPASTTAETVLV